MLLVSVNRSTLKLIKRTWEEQSSGVLQRQSSVLLPIRNDKDQRALLGKQSGCDVMEMTVLYKHAIKLRTTDTH